MYNLHERAIKEEFKANNTPDTKENRLKYYAGLLLRFDKKEADEQEAIANSLFQKFLYFIFTDFIPARSVTKKAAKRVEAEFFRMVRDPGTNQCQIIESVERIYIKLLKKLFKNKKWIICI